MTLLLSLLGVATLYFLATRGSGESSGSDAAPALLPVRAGVFTLLRKKDDAAPPGAEPVDATPPVDTTPPPADTPPPPPPADEAPPVPSHITLEPGRMNFCAFEGTFSIGLPSGARWASPPAEIFYTTGGWTGDNDYRLLKGSDALVLNSTESFFGGDFFWFDAAGKKQETKLLFTGPDKPGETGSDASLLCNLAGCASCAGRAPGSRVAGAHVAAHSSDAWSL